MQTEIFSALFATLAATLATPHFKEVYDDPANGKTASQWHCVDEDPTSTISDEGRPAEF